MSTITNEPYRFQARLIGGKFVELPVEQLRRIANASGVDSIEQETKHFSCKPFHPDISCMTIMEKRGKNLD